MIIKMNIREVKDQIRRHPQVVDYDGIVKIVETEYFSIFGGDVLFEAIGDNCTYTVIREILPNGILRVTIGVTTHDDFDDDEFDKGNIYDCRNCPNFYMKEGLIYTCASVDKTITDPLMDECYNLEVI